MGHRCLRGLPVLVHEVSRRVWGLRLRRTEPGLALALLLVLPSAHYKGVGVRIASFRSSIPTPPIPLSTLRGLPHDRARARLEAEPLLLSRRTLSFSTSYRFIPAHCNRGDFSTVSA